MFKKMISLRDRCDGCGKNSVTCFAFEDAEQHHATVTLCADCLTDAAMRIRHNDLIARSERCEGCEE
jgi:hypothetical protein